MPCSTCGRDLVDRIRELHPFSSRLRIAVQCALVAFDWDCIQSQANGNDQNNGLL
jgi:hypothetical protein